MLKHLDLGLQQFCFPHTKKKYDQSSTNYPVLRITISKKNKNPDLQITIKNEIEIASFLQL